MADGLMNVPSLCKQPKEHIRMDTAPWGPRHIAQGISLSLVMTALRLDDR